MKNKQKFEEKVYENFGVKQKQSYRQKQNSFFMVSFIIVSYKIQINQIIIAPSRGVTHFKNENKSYNFVMKY